MVEMVGDGGSVLRRKLSGDSKIFARISQAQVGLRWDFGYG